MDPAYFKTQSEIQRELGSGEKLLWSGQPRQGLRVGLADLFVIPFSLVWCGFAIFWETMAFKGNTPIFFKLWGVPFVAVGLYLVFGRFLVDARTRSRTYYGITNERLIIITGCFARLVRTLPWHALSEATLAERGDGSGAITFGPQLPFGLARQGNVGGWSAASQSAIPVLDLPERAREAYDAIRRAQQSIKPAESADPGETTGPRFTTSVKSLPPPPRNVRSRLGIGVWGVRLFIMPHMLIGIGAAGYLVFLLVWRLFGSDIPATVTGVGTSHSSKHGDSYTLKYRFESGGETKTGSDSASWALYQRYQNPSSNNPPVTVHYLGIGPLQHAALRESGSLWSMIGFLTLWACFWNGILSIFVYQIWVKPIRTRLLYKYGETAAGTLLHKRSTTGKSTTYYVSYRFMNPYSSQPIESEMVVLKADDWREAEQGQPVTVLFSRSNPKRSTVYEFGGYRVEGV